MVCKSEYKLRQVWGQEAEKKGNNWSADTKKIASQVERVWEIYPVWTKKQAGSWVNGKAIAILEDALRCSRSQSKMRTRGLKWRCVEGSKTTTGKINGQHCEAHVAIVPGAGLRNSRKKSKRL